MKVNELKKMIKLELSRQVKKNKKLNENGPMQEPEREDCFITDIVRGGYDVICGGKYIKHVNEIDEAIQLVKNWQKENNYYPTTWLVDDHGGTTPIDLDEGGIIQENSGKKRYIATIDFYVFGKDENEASREAQEIVSMIDEQYDNNPVVVSLKLQQFGRIGE